MQQCIRKKDGYKFSCFYDKVYERWQILTPTTFYTPVEFEKEFTLESQEDVNSGCEEMKKDRKYYENLQAEYEVLILQSEKDMKVLEAQIRLQAAMIDFAVAKLEALQVNQSE